MHDSHPLLTRRLKEMNRKQHPHLTPALSAPRGGEGEQAVPQCECPAAPRCGR